MRSGGRSRRNPTVSERSTRRREGNRTARTVGSSVANILEEVNTCVSECIEQRGFARIRVPDECDHPKRDCLPGPPTRGALAADGFDRLLDFSDAIADSPPVRLQFLFARPSGPDTAAEPRKLFPAACQSREKIIQLSELDLQLSFPAARVESENVENELGAVNHAAADTFLHVSELYGSEIVVHNYEGNAAKLSLLPNLLDLSVSDECCGIERVANLQQAPGNFCAGTLSQLSELFQRISADNVGCPARRAKSSSSSLLRARLAPDYLPVAEFSFVPVTTILGRVDELRCHLWSHYTTNRRYR